MRRRSNSPEEPSDTWEVLREKIIGLGDASLRKSYYPQLQQRLRDLERFRTLLDHSRDAILLVHLPSGRFADLNRSACRYLGRSREELLGSDLEELAREPRVRWLGELLRMPRGPEPERAETLAVHRDGEESWVEVTVRRVSLADAPYLVAVARDVTERRRAAAELTRLATAVAQAAEAIVITDPGGIISYVNPAFEQITGYSSEEALGSDVRLLESGVHRPEYYGRVWDTLARGEVWRGRFVNRRKDGSLCEVECAISPVRDEVGQVVDYVAVERDVTAEVRLERRVRQAQRLEALGTLAGGVAHDFSNLLMPILGFTQLALDDLPPGDEGRENLTRVLSAAQHARDLVQQILAFSRQGEAPERQVVRLSPLVKETLKLLGTTMPSSVEVQTRLTTERDGVMGDPAQLHQVLMNLCTNALHAMGEEGGVLQVSLEAAAVDERLTAGDLNVEPGDYVRLTVRDTGSGMAPEVIDHIFEPFFTTKGPGEGTGLGLAVVHGIVKSQGGAIGVRSTPDQGTTFEVYLPAARAEAEPHHEAELPIPRGSERILLVDDERSVTELGKEILEHLGYRVVTATDGVEALAVFRSDAEGFRLVITDQLMPGLTGTELARQISAVRPGTPVILCSGHHVPTAPDGEAAPGLREVLVKPVSARDLGLAVRRVLDAGTRSEG